MSEQDLSKVTNTPSTESDSDILDEKKDGEQIS